MNFKSINMKTKMIMISLFILLANSSFAQNFGDSYQSVLGKVNGIIKKSHNAFIKCNLDVPGIEGTKTYGFNSRGELVSLITQQFLNKEDGKALYDAYCNNYQMKFGYAKIDGKKEKCYEGNDCWKIKSKWVKNDESLMVNYYTVSGESLVQTHYLIRKY